MITYREESFEKKYPIYIYSLEDVTIILQRHNYLDFDI